MAWLLGSRDRLGRWVRCTDDADALLVACLVAELDGPLARGEEGVVAPHPDVLAGIEGAPPLANDDRAGVNLLAVAALHAEPLSRRVAAVPARTARLLVCHCSLLLCLRPCRAASFRLLGGR